VRYLLQVFSALSAFLAASLRSRVALQIEILALRHPLCVLERSVKRPRLNCPGPLALGVVVSSVVQLARTRSACQTSDRHRLAIQKLSHVLDLEVPSWPSRKTVALEVRHLIRRISRENPLWGAPKFHGELLKLGFEISESTVSKYLVRPQGMPSQDFLEEPCEELSVIPDCPSEPQALI
jgi:putative transposase